jgi:KipI family sensor histidine kinase inhibitor
MNQGFPAYQKLTPILGELTWNSKSDDTLLAIQLAWKEAIDSNFGQNLIQIRLGFTTLTMEWKSPEYQIAFEKNFKNLTPSPKNLSSKIWKVPVCYEAPFSTDLERLANEKGISQSELIRLHSDSLYRIHFFGFLPGFMYLKGLPILLHTPRKKIPDRTVSAGSVAIGGEQTGIYPQQSPGGWHIIGQTPITLFSAKLEPPVWAQIGDQVRFVPISSQYFQELEHQPELWKWE